MTASTHLTACEYWQANMPRTMELLLNPDAAFADDTKQAATLAGEMGITLDGPALPVEVWDAFYDETAD